VDSVKGSQNFKLDIYPMYDPLMKATSMNR